MTDEDRTARASKGRKKRQAASQPYSKPSALTRRTELRAEPAASPLQTGSERIGQTVLDIIRFVATPIMSRFTPSRRTGDTFEVPWNYNGDGADDKVIAPASPTPRARVGNTLPSLTEAIAPLTDSGTNKKANHQLSDLSANKPKRPRTRRSASLELAEVTAASSGGTDQHRLPPPAAEVTADPKGPEGAEKGTTTGRTKSKSRKKKPKKRIPITAEPRVTRSKTAITRSSSIEGNIDEPHPMPAHPSALSSRATSPHRITGSDGELCHDDAASLPSCHSSLVPEPPASRQTSLSPILRPVPELNPEADTVEEKETAIVSQAMDILFHSSLPAASDHSDAEVPLHDGYESPRAADLDGSGDDGAMDAEETVVKIVTARITETVVAFGTSESNCAEVPPRLTPSPPPATRTRNASRRNSLAPAFSTPTEEDSPVAVSQPPSPPVRAVSTVEIQTDPESVPSRVAEATQTDLETEVSTPPAPQRVAEATQTDPEPEADPDTISFVPLPQRRPLLRKVTQPAVFHSPRPAKVQMHNYSPRSEVLNKTLARFFEEKGGDPLSREELQDCLRIMRHSSATSPPRAAGERPLPASGPLATATTNANATTPWGPHPSSAMGESPSPPPSLRSSSVTAEVPASPSSTRSTRRYSALSGPLLNESDLAPAQQAKANSLASPNRRRTLGYAGSGFSPRAKPYQTVPHPARASLGSGSGAGVEKNNRATGGPMRSTRGLRSALLVSRANRPILRDIMSAAAKPAERETATSPGSSAAHPSPPSLVGWKAPSSRSGAATPRDAPVATGLTFTVTEQTVTPPPPPFALRTPPSSIASTPTGTIAITTGANAPAPVAATPPQSLTSLKLLDILGEMPNRLPQGPTSSSPLSLGRLKFQSAASPAVKRARESIKQNGVSTATGDQTGGTEADKEPTVTTASFINPYSLYTPIKLRNTARDRTPEVGPAKKSAKSSKAASAASNTLHAGSTPARSHSDTADLQPVAAVPPLELLRQTAPENFPSEEALPPHQLPATETTMVMDRSSTSASEELTPEPIPLPKRTAPGFSDFSASADRPVTSLANARRDAELPSSPSSTKTLTPESESPCAAKVDESKSLSVIPSFSFKPPSSFTASLLPPMEPTASAAWSVKKGVGEIDPPSFTFPLAPAFGNTGNKSGPGNPVSVGSGTMVCDSENLAPGSASHWPSRSRSVTPVDPTSSSPVAVTTTTTTTTAETNVTTAWPPLGGGKDMAPEFTFPALPQSQKLRVDALGLSTAHEAGVRALAQELRNANKGTLPMFTFPDAPKSAVTVDTLKTFPKTLATPPASSSSAPGATDGWAGLGFKPAGLKTGEWKCGTCGIVSQAKDPKCIVCEAPRPSEAASTSTATLAPSSIAVSVTTTTTTAPTTMSSWADIGFKIPALQPDQWKCGTCSVVNKSETAKCIVCEASKPVGAGTGTSVATAATSPPASTAAAATATTSSSWADIGFKLPGLKEGQWKCGTCSIVNEAKFNKCLVCEASRPVGSDTDTSVATATTSPPASTATATTSSSWADIGFKLPGLKEGQWKCGTCGIVNEAKVNKCLVCEASKP
ncbi:hypothetical protein IWQ60_004974 [Tieghemiomyces parasiticus]|uniref:RanBP2-type domain-containing protein n=1 Tax=Tieghemiomyces parasiticus TaxID=78921 RepID=A0A9W8DZA0_9FUNG|nr:hypothetical protein IWQ60_004974 [Tieghemiomyces parasiticus]